MLKGIIFTFDDGVSTFGCARTSCVGPRTLLDGLSGPINTFHTRIRFILNLNVLEGVFLAL